MPVKDIMRERARADWSDLRPLNQQMHPFRLTWVTNNIKTPQYRHTSRDPRKAPLDGNDVWTHLSATKARGYTGVSGKEYWPDPIIAWRIEQNVAMAGAPPFYRELESAGPAVLLPARVAA